MNILVVSDTHGYLENTLQFINQNRQTIDEIWHLGDYYKDALTLHALSNIPVFAVMGNGDVHTKGPDALVLERMGHRVYLTHGHHYGVKSTLQRLAYKCIENNIDLVCFGHTHFALCETLNNLTLFNPGSPTRPYPGQRAKLGLIKIEPGTIETHWEYV